MSVELAKVLDAVVESRGGPAVYPRPTRAGVIRSLIEEAHARVKRAESKSKTEAA